MELCLPLNKGPLSGGSASRALGGVFGLQTQEIPLKIRSHG